MEEPPAPHPESQPAEPPSIPTMVVTAAQSNVVDSTPLAGGVESISAPRPGTVSPDDIVYTPYALSVGDGFKFGCGVVLAIGVALMIGALIAAVLVLLASLAGISLPLGPALI